MVENCLAAIGLRYTQSDETWNHKLDAAISLLKERKKFALKISLEKDGFTFWSVLILTHG
jgi:hypothetical protein